MELQRYVEYSLSLQKLANCQVYSNTIMEKNKTHLKISIGLSSAKSAGLPAESATEDVVETVHVAQPNRFLSINLIGEI